MLKKITAVFALALVGLFAAPVAANASYVPNAGTISGSVTPGGTSSVSFGADTFQPGETVSFTLTGENASGATLAAVETKSLEKTASSSGAVDLNVTLPSNATGSYQIKATGLSSQLIGTATLTVTAAGAGGDNDNDLADTGFDAPAFVVWGAGGAIALGAALIAVLVMVRRQRASASA